MRALLDAARAMVAAAGRVLREPAGASRAAGVEILGDLAVATARLEGEIVAFSGVPEGTGEAWEELLATAQAFRLREPTDPELHERLRQDATSYARIASRSRPISEVASPSRRRLPDLRPGKTLHFVIYSTQGNGEGKVVEVDGYVTTGEYDDGRPGEIFARVGKSGAESAIFDQWAIAFSVALQCGADFEGLCRKFVGSSFEPSGPTSVEGIPRCTSVSDLACRWLLRLYGPKEA